MTHATHCLDGQLLYLKLTHQYCKDTGHQKENCIKLNWQLALEQQKVDKMVASNANTMTAAGQLPEQWVNWTLL